MIVEENELRVAFKDLQLLISDVRVCVVTATVYPTDEVSLIRYLKEKILEYDKYQDTLESLLRILRSSATVFRHGIIIKQKLYPEKQNEIEERAQKLLDECHYSTLISEVAHLQSALKMLHNEVSGKVEEHEETQDKQGKQQLSNEKKIKKGTLMLKREEKENESNYFTSDEESDSSIEWRNTQATKKVSAKSYKREELPYRSETRHRIEESDHVGQVISGAWNTDDLAKIMAAFNKINNVGNQVRFPEIKIPIYNGDRNKFEEFWAVLQQMVHSNIAFPPIEKFLYLTNSLTEKAAEAIKGIAMVAENYQQVIDIIKEKFGNRQDNEASIAKQLKNLELASKSIRNCRQVFNKIQSLIRQLKAVGRSISKDSDPLWKEINYDKFPNRIREKVYMAMKRDKETKWTINKMISYIDDLIAVRETYEGGEDVHFEAESNKKPYQNDTKRMAYKSNPITSRFCQQGHKYVECKTHRTPEERRNSLGNRRKC